MADLDEGAADVKRDRDLGDNSGRNASMRTAMRAWPAFAFFGGGVAFMLVLAAGQLRKGNYPLAIIATATAVACAVFVGRLIQGLRRYVRTGESAPSTQRSANRGPTRGRAGAPSVDDQLRVYAEIKKGRPIAPADRRTAELVLNRRIWRSWRLAVLVLAVPATAWQLYVNGALLAAGRGQWLSLTFFGIAAVVILLAVRQQILLRRWQRRFGGL
jgi:hypothetical protein